MTFVAYGGAALDQGAFAEHLDDRLAQRLRAVEHGQDPVVVAQPAGDEIGQQIGDHHGVLSVAEHQTDGHLVPSAVMIKATVII